MSKTLTVIAVAVLAAAVACSDNSPDDNGSIKLSASQATMLNTRIDLAVAGTTELAWLADSANLALREGAVVDTVSITTDLGPGPYYGIGLQRAMYATNSPSATFDAILFNDPANPTRFIIVSGWAQGTSLPPGAVSRVFGAPPSTSSMSGHLYAIDGTAVTHWRATAGSASLVNDGSAPPCTSFVATTLVSCESSGLKTTFAITASVRESGAATGTRTATMATATLRGIRLLFEVP